jgi:hypothetical protein
MTKGLPSQLFLDFRSSLCIRQTSVKTVGRGVGVWLYLLYILKALL